ncbi:ParD-like family protein [Pantoea sp. 18069]|uniref:ParD-like family protein n=1 Tax=Pantoea sp. 18069 TaxID=2681415 RepID=UPI0013584FE1|nr:ParD-like family protein [Pantoea sp. 18069]
MGIVKISDALHDSVRTASTALSRSINAQAEHWLRVGMMAELHPQLTYSDICQLLIQHATPASFALPVPPRAKARPQQTPGAAQ